MASDRRQPTVPPRPSFLDDEEEAVKKAIALSLVTAELDEKRRLEKYSGLWGSEGTRNTQVQSQIARPRPQPPPRPKVTLKSWLQTPVSVSDESVQESPVEKMSLAELQVSVPRVPPPPPRPPSRSSRNQKVANVEQTPAVSQQNKFSQQNGFLQAANPSQESVDEPLITFSPSLDPSNFDLESLDPLKSGSDPSLNASGSQTMDLNKCRSSSVKTLTNLDTDCQNLACISSSTPSKPESVFPATTPTSILNKAILNASNSLLAHVNMSSNKSYGVLGSQTLMMRSPSQENLYLPPAGWPPSKTTEVQARTSLVSESSGYTIPDGALIIHHPEPGDLMDFTEADDSREYLSLESFDPLYSLEKSFDMEQSTDSLGLFPNPLDRLQRKNTPNPFPDINPVTTQRLMSRASATSSTDVTPSSSRPQSTVSKSSDELQDPFDMPDLLKALERKRQNHAKDQAQRLEAQRKEEENKDMKGHSVTAHSGNGKVVTPRTSRSSSYIQAGEESSYEILHYFSETADEEIQAFCAMVASLKMKHHNTDEKTNPGIVISRQRPHPLYKGMTVKLLVKATFIEEPGYPFTCDVNATVSHVIGAVLLSCTDSLGANSTENYALKVHGFSEYLLNDTCLADYIYVQQCLKLDVDIKFHLVEKSKIDRVFLRTPADDRNPLFVPKTRDNTENGMKVTREKLNILMETFYKEVEKLRDSAIQNGLHKVQCKSVIQCVKAICALMYQMESIDVLKAIQRLQSVNLEKTLHISNSYDKDSYGYVMRDGEDIISVKDVDTELKVRDLDDLHIALEELTMAVKSMIELYCRTFHTDFRFKSTTQVVREQKESNEVKENLIVHIASAHRISLKYRNMYKDYKIICGLYYGGQKLSPEVITTTQPKWAPIFGETLMWDEWVMFESVMVCNLPREARLCFTLVGVKEVVSSNSDHVQNVNTPLGWVGLQLFNYEFKLTQGSQLLGLWPGDMANPTGTSLSNTEMPHSILLHVNLPQFDCDYIFPSIQEPSPSIKQDFECLHPDDQDAIKGILEKDSITRLPESEAQLLWDKRHFLYEIPEALPRILQLIGSWYWGSLAETYSLLSNWAPLSHAQALELMLPCYPDTVIRKKGTTWLSNAPIDEHCDYLPQLVQALKFESYHTSALASLILEKAICSVRVAHDLYWLLKEAADDIRYRKRYQLMFGALLSVVGEKMRKELTKEQDVVKMFASVAEKVKTSKDKENVLARELFSMWEFLDFDSVRLPLNPAIEISGIDVKSCTYFTSFTFPLKLVLKNMDPKADVHYAMFKVGDDLRQDMLTMQLIEVMDKLWLKEGLDLRMITFKCIHTGTKKGLVEIVTESETLRKIQTKHGVAGSFKDRPIAEWLQLQNPTELEYQKAVDNFTASCAGYCVATYILGIGDRHNDNIMIKQSGHMFHIDFAKFLGESQMFGSFKRDRVPFVLTQDMAYVINGGEKPSHKFQHFIDLCCKAFNIIRKYGNLFINLLSMMVLSGIPGVTDDAAKYIQKALLPDTTDAEATAIFTRMLHGSLKSTFTQFNFFLHNLAQMKFHGHSDGGLLSFIPKTYTIKQDGRIKDVMIHGIQKRYSPEKFYLYIIRVERVNQAVPNLVFRRYSEFQELHHKLILTFPLVKLPSLHNRVILGRTHVRSVAEERKEELEHFLRELLQLAPEISECDLIYTFFHPMLKDEQDAGKINLQKLREPSPPKEPSRVIHGQVKLSIVYKNNLLTVMIMHVKDLSAMSGGVAPDPYVKLYLLPDPHKHTKRKTTIQKNTYHPTYNEVFQYHMSLENIRSRTLQVSVWNYDKMKENDFLGAAFIPLSDIDLFTEHTDWYTLRSLHIMSTAGR